MKFNSPEYFAALYSPKVQYGGAVLEPQFYRSSYSRQRGEGLGSIFGALARRLMPFVRNHILPAAQKYIIPAAKQGITNLVSDVIEGKNVKSSVVDRGRQVFNDIGKSITSQTGSGRKRKCCSSKKPVKRQANSFLSYSHNT